MARDKIDASLESLKYLKYFDGSLTKFENNGLLLNKFVQSLLSQTKLVVTSITAVKSLYCNPCHT